MNAYNLLRDDHRRVATIFDKLDSTTERALKTREELFDKLNNELEAHAAIEEQIFYPALKQAAETRDIILEAIEEHSVVKEVLNDLTSIAKDTEKWTAKLTVLKENVEHHLEEEEGELFKEARSGKEEMSATAR